MLKYFYSHDNVGERLCCEYPNLCPICNHNISPDSKMEFVNHEIKIVSILFICPYCGKGFVSHYELSDDIENFQGYQYLKINLIGSYPNLPDKIEFDKTINDLSTNFCEIYNQASAAETYNLNQISGIGYRKALEFLIKDYCIYKHPDKEHEIKTNFLSNVIKNYVDIDKIKTLSKASSWIGNDETHYVRVYDDKDINDLKRFISATIAFITYDLTSDEALQLIESK